MKPNTALADDPQIRALVTPEGIDLRVRIATASERGAALLIDIAILVGVLIVMTILAVLALGAAKIQGADQVAAIIWLLGAFVLRNFYFTGFECSARGATPGKRIMGIRIASRDGGALNADRVVARNAMRELELWLPMSFLFADGREIGAIIALCGIIWCAIFVFFPLFNRDRLRLGDIVAGTWVLKAPKRTLLPDLAERARDATFNFTQAQLDVYGVKELQVLEFVLRTSDPNAMEAVAQRIRAKTGRTRQARELDYEFLNAYYAALRRRLEQRLLFGVRKRDKFDRT